MHTRSSGKGRVQQTMVRRAFASARLCITLAVGLALRLLAGLLGYNSSDARSLRKYKAQLRAQGEKLTLAELASDSEIDFAGVKS